MPEEHNEPSFDHVFRDLVAGVLQQQQNRGTSLRTQHHSLATYKSLSSYGQRVGIFDSDPLAELAIPTPKKLSASWTCRQIGEVLRAAHEPYRDVLCLMAAVPLRLVEVVLLRSAHVDFATGEIHVPAGKTAARVVPLTTAAAAVLAAGKPDRGLWFGQERHGNPNAGRYKFARGVQAHVQRIAESLGLKGGTAEFRKGFYAHVARGAAKEQLAREWEEHVDRTILQLCGSHDASVSVSSIAIALGGKGDDSVNS